MYAIEVELEPFPFYGKELAFSPNIGAGSRESGRMRELTMDEIEFVSGARFRWGAMGAGEYAVPFAWGAAMGGMGGYAMSGTLTGAGIGAFFGGVNAAGSRFLSK